MMEEVRCDGIGKMMEDGRGKVAAAINSVERRAGRGMKLLRAGGLAELKQVAYGSAT